MKKIVLVLIFVSSFAFVKAQLSASYYSTMNFSKIGLGYDFSDRIWSELKIFGGCAFDKLYIEPTLSYNYVKKEDYSLYVGTGISIGKNLMAILPVGTRIKPFMSNEHIFLHFELQPTYDFSSASLGFYYFLGLRYKF